MKLRVINLLVILECAIAGNPPSSKPHRPFRYSLHDAPTCESIQICILSTSPVCTPPVNFPGGIALKLGNFKNWALEFKLRNVWIATPRTPTDVVTLADWAGSNGYTLRPSGFSHNWSPIVVTGEEGPCSKVVLIDTREFLDKMEMVMSTPGNAAVRVETGASLEALFTFLEERGYGILGHPAPGDITIGGAIAVGAHGTGVRLEVQGANVGTLSNLLLSLDAVVWDDSLKRFRIQTFHRQDPEMSALSINLGRIFLTKVTLEVSRLVNFSCLTRIDIPVKEIFGFPENGTNSKLSMSTFQDTNQALEVTWFPFTANPWVKFWTVAPTKPLFYRRTLRPYNYPFSDNYPLEFNNMISSQLVRTGELVPPLMKAIMTFTGQRLVRARSLHLWGPSKNLFLYVKSTTLRLTANGYAILTPRAHVQLVLNRFFTFYENLIQTYANQNVYPISGPLEIRISGLDTGINSIPGTRAPTLSPLKPVEHHPEIDTAIWLDCLTLHNAPRVHEMMSKVETFLVTELASPDVVVRPEWSKGFAYTNQSGWSNAEFLSDYTPRIYGMEDWNFTVSVFKKYDPQGVFTNKFLRQLFK